MPCPTSVRRLRRAPAIVTLALVALGFAGPAPAHAGPLSPQLGLSTHAFWLGQGDAEREFARLHAGGVDWVREDFRWDQLEPEKGVMRWGRTDSLMAAAAKTGVDVLAILDYSAPWASSDPSGERDIHYPPRDAADYAAFARRVAERYGSHGSFWQARPDLPHRPLTAVEMWNEPWGFWYWKPKPAPSAYAALVEAAATAVKAAQPEMKVLMSGDPIAINDDGTSAPFLEAALAARPGLGRLIDVYSTHPYPSSASRSPLETSMPAAYRFDRAHLTHEIAGHYDADKPIWITEIGWTTAPAHADGVSEATQADYIADAIVSGLGRQGVERVFVFGWDRSSGIATDGEGNMGLQRSDGSLKPAWARITALASQGLPSGAAASESDLPAPSPPPITPSAPAAAPAPDPGVPPPASVAPVSRALLPSPTAAKAPTPKQRCATKGCALGAATIGSVRSAGTTRTTSSSATTSAARTTSRPRSRSCPTARRRLAASRRSRRPGAARSLRRCLRLLSVASVQKRG